MYPALHKLFYCMHTSIQLPAHRMSFSTSFMLMLILVLLDEGSCSCYSSHPTPTPSWNKINEERQNEEKMLTYLCCPTQEHPSPMQNVVGRKESIRT